MTPPESKGLSGPIFDIRELGPIECGEDAARYFGFDEGYRNLNHGEFQKPLTHKTISSRQKKRLLQAKFH